MTIFLVTFKFWLDKIDFVTVDEDNYYYENKYQNISAPVNFSDLHILCGEIELSHGSFNIGIN